MKIETHVVVVKTVNPDGNRQVAEVANLMAVPTIFYDYQTGNGNESCEIRAVEGYFTVIGNRLYRLHPIPPERITQASTELAGALLEVVVPWDQLER